MTEIIAAIAILAWMTWKPHHAMWLHEKALDVVELVRLGRGGQ